MEMLFDANALAIFFTILMAKNQTNRMHLEKKLILLAFRRVYRLWLQQISCDSQDYVCSARLPFVV